VPGADREAIVAAIDAVAHGHAEFLGDMALVLDGEIGDAAPRIEPVGRRKGLCRADIETVAAAAAMILFRRIGGEIERREDLAEEEPGAVAARDEIGVLALPADAG